MPLAQDYPTPEDIRRQRETKKLTKEDVELLNRFKSHADSFARSYNNLVAQRERISKLNIIPLTQEYNLLLDKGSRLGNTIESVALGVNQAIKKLRQQWGDDFIENGTAADILEHTTSVLGTLGLHPAWYLVGGIGLSAAVQLLLDYLSQTDSFSRKLDSVTRFVDENPQLSKEEIAAYVSSLHTTGRANNWFMWILLAGVAWLIFANQRR